MCVNVINGASGSSHFFFRLHIRTNRKEIKLEMHTDNQVFEHALCAHTTRSNSRRRRRCYVGEIRKKKMFTKHIFHLFIIDA